MIMRYFIIGFKNSGKTTFGRILARRLKLGFTDLDEYMENQEGMTIPEIYSRLGEEGFRRLEWKTLKKVVKNHEQCVISTGGGAPCHCDNMSLMEEYGDVIYLQVSDKTLVDRLKHAVKDRPIVMGKSEEELREFISNLRWRCEHLYQRAKYKVNGENPDLEGLVRQIKQNSAY